MSSSTTQGGHNKQNNAERYTQGDQQRRYSKNHESLPVRLYHVLLFAW